MATIKSAHETPLLIPRANHWFLFFIHRPISAAPMIYKDTENIDSNSTNRAGDVPYKTFNVWLNKKPPPIIKITEPIAGNTICHFLVVSIFLFLMKETV